eukprot:3597161-Prymnesium_polylepis.2
MLSALEGAHLPRWLSHVARTGCSILNKAAEDAARARGRVGARVLAHRELEHLLLMPVNVAHRQYSVLGRGCIWIVGGVRFVALLGDRRATDLGDRRQGSGRLADPGVCELVPASRTAHKPEGRAILVCDIGREIDVGRQHAHGCHHVGSNELRVTLWARVAVGLHSGTCRRLASTSSRGVRRPVASALLRSSTRRKTVSASAVKCRMASLYLQGRMRAVDAYRPGLDFVPARARWAAQSHTSGASVASPGATSCTTHDHEESRRRGYRPRVKARPGTGHPESDLRASRAQQKMGIQDIGQCGQGTDFVF